MTKIYRLIMAAGLMVCGCLFAQESWARVCFAPDENCETGATFGDAQGLDDMLDERCKEAGYTQTGCQPYELEYACPYKSSIKNCCPADYVYQTCMYPLIPAGKCGGKYKCVCDSEKYPFTEEKCHTDYKFSNPGGTACTQIDAKDGTTTRTLYYSACLCERGLYPYSKEDCAETANAEVNGDPCTDSQGNSYWDSCKCDNPPYQWESIDCEFGGKGKACVQGGVYFFKECCSCAAFPAEGDRGSRPYDTHATQWSVCDCPRKGRFKITQCSEGWVPNKDGSACERISCENAVKLYFKKHPNDSTYAVFTGSKLVHYNALTQAEIDKLPLEQQTYAVGAEVENTKATIGVLAKDVTVEGCWTSSGHVGCTKAATIYSGAYFGTLGTTADHQMVREACGAEDPEKTVVPVMSYSVANFPSNYSNATSINIYGAELKFSGATTVYRTLNFYNANLSGSGATFNNNVNLNVVTSKPNRYPIFKMTSSNFKNKLTATGYDFDLGTSGNMYIIAPSSSKNGNIAAITLYEGQEFRGGSLYIYPETDSYVAHNRNNGNTFPSATNWGSYVTFSGPSSSTPANVYTNVYIGYRSSTTNRARQMFVKLNGNLKWNMYEGSTQYKIGLTSGSSITSTDYGVGNYAKIAFSSSTFKKTCSMRSTVYYIVNRHKFLSCATKNWDEDSIYYAACTIDYKNALSSISTTGEMSCRKSGDCGCRTSRFEADCKIEYSYDGTNRNDAGDKPGELLTCQ